MITIDNLLANNSLARNLNEKEKFSLIDFQEDLLWYWDKIEYYRKNLVLDGIFEPITKEQANYLNEFYREAMIDYVHKMSKKKDKKIT
jgi:hypothetical protein